MDEQMEDNVLFNDTHTKYSGGCLNNWTTAAHGIHILKPCYSNTMTS